MRRAGLWLAFLVVMLAMAGLSGCANYPTRSRQAASVVEYLYPSSQPPQPTDAITHLKLPVRVGIAFVPAGRLGARGISESERAAMLERVKASFQDRPFISQIEVIPDAYLRPGGGFENLDQVSRMLQVDVVCLLSYDQVQYGEDNSAALLYWTIVGAYLIPATKYSTHTLLDAAVVDVKSRRLLFRAPGVSSIEGHRARLAADQYRRQSQEGGFAEALDKLVPALHGELDRFKDRVKNDATVQVEHRPGSKGGALDLLGLALFAAVAGLYARGG